MITTTKKLANSKMDGMTIDQLLPNSFIVNLSPRTTKKQKQNRNYTKNLEKLSKLYKFLNNVIRIIIT